MKGLTLASLFIAGALAHPSGLWWGTDTCYPSPENTNNECLESQKSGFDWSELANGDNWTFEGFNFVGFSPNNACGAAGGKCIMGKLSRDDNYMLRVDAVDAPFSVRKFHLSTSRKTDVLINYGMADGSSCHHVTFSTPEGRDVSNSQCGGAISVQFMLPEESKIGECDLNIHEIDFDCSGGPKTPSFPEPSSSLSTPTTHSFIRHSTTMIEVPSHTSNTKPEVVSTAWNTVETTVTKCSPDETFCPGHSTVVVTSTYTRPTTLYESKTATEPTSTSPASTVTSTRPSTPIISPPCPNLVPKCINTWLTIPQCASNSDARCFCPSSEFTEKVKSCIHAWGSSEKEINSALSYFAGICAPYVPQNTAIIDIVPTCTSSLPITASTGHLELPSTTVLRGQTGMITPTPKVPETTVTWSSTTMTCPKVGFSTFTQDATPTVALVVPYSSTSIPSTTKQDSVPSSSTRMMTSCDMSKTMATGPPAKPTETVHYSSSGSRENIGNFWSLSMIILSIFLV